LPVAETNQLAVGSVVTLPPPIRLLNQFHH
jgi:hypothetical protein